MDPVSLIVAAVAAGAAEAAKGTASVAVKDAYAALKSLLRSHFAGKPQASVALQEFESDPETWKKPLEKAVTESGLSEDKNALAQADQVLKLLHPEQHASGKYAVQVTGDVQGMQVGDYGTQHNVFGGKASENKG
jgi:hypothetical protein